MKKVYIPIYIKFILSHLFALTWMGVSIYLSIPWLIQLSAILTFPVALFIIIGIAYIPGYFNAILVISLLLDKQPKFKTTSPKEEITILVAARNEEKGIYNTLKFIANQDYEGKINVFVIDNGSKDQTGPKALEAGKQLNLDVTVFREDNPGKYNALNHGLRNVKTELIITLDADTLMHKSAVRYLVSRMKSAPSNVCAVAGSVLVRNSRDNIITRMQEWDYFLAIASIKRFQGLYQGTLVAQGAFSIYRVDVVKSVGGWPNAIGEDIVLTWYFLKDKWKVYFEPMAVAFTDVPVTMKHFTIQRARWARGMIEALRITKPWQQPLIYVKYMTAVDLLLPYLDFIYTFCWLPGLIAALFFHIYWIVGLQTLLVLPVTFISYYILYIYQKRVFKELKLKVRDNWSGLILFTLCYQMIMSPVSLYGYVQELFNVKRTWK